MNELLRQSPLCQVGCATSPEAFTLPSLMGQDDWAPEAFTLLSHWTGQVDWTLYKQPEAFTG